MNTRRKRVRFITHSALIASVYLLLTLIFSPISYGAIQVRVSEALTLLPIFTPAAIPGLFVGCALSNLYAGSVIDLIAGSFATLIAAVLTYLLRKNRFIAAIPPVAVNAAVIPFVLKYAYHSDEAFYLLIASIGAGQLISCFAIGIPLSYALEKSRLFTKQAADK